jgi:hypothetical protein
VTVIDVHVGRVRPSLVDASEWDDWSGTDDIDLGTENLLRKIHHARKTCYLIQLRTAEESFLLADILKHGMSMRDSRVIGSSTYRKDEVRHV